MHGVVVVARNTFRSQNVDSTPPGGMLKTCTPLWRETHVEVKMLKAPQQSAASDHVEVRMRKTNHVGTSLGRSTAPHYTTTTTTTRTTATTTVATAVPLVLLVLQVLL